MQTWQIDFWERVALEVGLRDYWKVAVVFRIDAKKVRRKLLRRHTVMIRNPHSADVTWSVFGQWHREDGPAREYANGKEWWRNGQRHREDGPAMESPYGKSWYLSGKKYTFLEFAREIVRRNK